MLKGLIRRPIVVIHGLVGNIFEVTYYKIYYVSIYQPLAIYKFLLIKFIDTNGSGSAVITTPRFVVSFF